MIQDVFLSNKEKFLELFSHMYSKIKSSDFGIIHGPAIDEISEKPQFLVDYNRTKRGDDIWYDVFKLLMLKMNSKIAHSSFLYYGEHFFRCELLCDVQSLHWHYKHENRLDFMIVLAQSLVAPFMQWRLGRGHLAADLRLFIKWILRIEDPQPQPRVEVFFQSRKHAIIPVLDWKGRHSIHMWKTYLFRVFEKSMCAVYQGCKQRSETK